MNWQFGSYPRAVPYEVYRSLLFRNVLDELMLQFIPIPLIGDLIEVPQEDLIEVPQDLTLEDLDNIRNEHISFVKRYF